MDVFFMTQRGSSFSIEVGYWDTVLEIKKKIEKYQRIPVSKQTLFFQGNILQDHLDIEQCKFLHKSRVTVLVSNDQVLQPEQPPAPSKSIGDSLVRNNDESQPSDAAKQIINGKQDSTVTIKTEESTPSSNVTVQVPRTEQSQPSNSVRQRDH
ncbi:Ubiquitin domain-containing protein 7SL RNA1 [Cardamine amara subsp. amara]|uniref:Ubiquitin domain-containing protein 7SL RNA1 n=1 Tax=Cardamine amara subsp. amara TaxID=228776 RepID=A0ABD1B6Q8_CARAN